MELSERKRSRKSQSFKLVNQDYHHDIFKATGYISDVNGDCRDSQLYSDEGMEIKKQITGMRRLLNDSVGRIYQRVGKEGDQLKEEPRDLDMNWNEDVSNHCAPERSVHPSQSSWTDGAIQNTDLLGHYGTRSKTVQNHVKSTGSNVCITPGSHGDLTAPVIRVGGGRSGDGKLSIRQGELRMGTSLQESKCCVCNCQPTLHAILQELKAMRKFMQVQAVAQNRQQIPQSCVCNQKTLVARKRIMKKKVLPKTLSVTPIHRMHGMSEKEPKEQRPVLLPERASLPEVEHVKKEDLSRGFGIVVSSSSSDPEIQLAEGFDVVMQKSQLDSILSNYKRSGSLLFRKLVCAFFDDKTLASSLPNGKRKRGLNDNRQGLDQNIVGAIKVFTEKYCTANNVEKVPGPRHWVQILQDQIKLARRRLKRGSDLGRNVQVI